MPTLRPRLILAALGATLAGCSSDAPTVTDGPQPSTLDVAALVSQMTLPSATATMSSVRPAPTAGALPANCAYAAASQSFVCPPATSGGLTVKTSYTLLDAGSRPLATADAKTTAAVRVVTTIDGAESLPGAAGVAGTTTIAYRQDMLLSGLLTDARTLDGTATTTTTGRYTLPGSTTPATVSSRSTTTTERVVIPATSGGTGAAWPRSGTVTTEVASDLDLLGQALSTRVVTTFNGTSRVPIVITPSIGAPLRCTADLTGATLPVCN